MFCLFTVTSFPLFLSSLHVTTLEGKREPARSATNSRILLLTIHSLIVRVATLFRCIVFAFLLRRHLVPHHSFVHHFVIRHFIVFHLVILLLIGLNRILRIGWDDCHA